MKNQTRRVLVSVFWSGLSILLLAILLRASTSPVLADQSTDIAFAPQNAPAAQVVSDWDTWMLDTYDGTFDDIQREITATGSVDLSWGRVITSHAGFDDTLWCVGGNQDPVLDADTDLYTNSVTTTLTYGPINMSKVVEAELSFDHWVALASGDGFEWGYSTNGSDFTFAEVTHGVASSWENTLFNTESSAELEPLLGERWVYLAFRFYSDDDDQRDRGVFLDNVQFRVKYPTTMYMPTMSSRWFEEYTYTHDFETWDVWRHGSKKEYNSDGSVAEEFSYGYKLDSDGSNVYMIRVSDNHDHVFLTGPAYALQNFRYRVFMRLATDREAPVWGDEYGILISPVPINPKHPNAEGVYTFQIRLKQDGDGEPSYVIKKWDIYDSFDHPADEIHSNSSTSHLTQTPKKWNKFRIDRVGNTLTFCYAKEDTDWKCSSHTVTDEDLPDKLYIGFYAAHTMYSYSMEYQFDNVLLRSYP